MLITENLGKTYNTKIRKSLFKKEKVVTEAVKGLSMEIKEGQIVGLLGVNGAGKTTTIKMLSTLLEPTNGTISIDGYDILKDTIKVKKLINMVAGGERMIYWRLTGKENLWYYGQLYNIPNDILNKRMDRLLKLVDLEKSKDVPVERYSKGMKQRLQIARGLINNPKYIFMDEPTLGLDAPIAKELREYTKKLAFEEGKAILLTSHYMHEVEELCDYLYILDEGRLITEGTTKDIALIANEERILKIELANFSKELEEAINELCDNTQSTLNLSKKEILSEITITSSKDVSSEIAAILSNNNASIRKFSLVEPKLEDAIIKLSRRNEYA